MIYHIYTDGGTRGNGAENAIGGFGVFIQELDLKYKEQIHEKPNTNQKAELLAAIRGLQLMIQQIDQQNLTDVEEITLYSDSAYLINGMNSWIHNWIRNGWVNSKKQPVANREYWESLISLNNALYNDYNISLTWCKVQGHADCKYNILVDQLANDAMDGCV